jgi:hypothetical protein
MKCSKCGCKKRRRRNISDEDLEYLKQQAELGDLNALMELPIEVQKDYYRARWEAGLCHIHDQPLQNCAICNHGPARNVINNMGIDLLMRDLGPNASVYEIAQWIQDRSKPTHMDKTFNEFDPRICKIPGGIDRLWASFDTIDMSADVFHVVDEKGRHLFTALNDLENWHQLTRLVERQQPMLYAQPRPTEKEALAFFTSVVGEILGTINQPLRALHYTGPASTSFAIVTADDHEIGTVTYRIDTMEFDRVGVNFNYWDGELR